ncbi:hypothetical protein SAMN05660657_04600 [Geodermatophilus amargosae]|uniref:Uncharacterized protein n=1 Tax=Geodermatophilus amargosae TaxID=1296565 RepID=A0A1I7CKW7_9ACTN|nr:hypothetical protein [Geodermatophilus amargosae]SFU00029.1 hypothetical protein SAMN05660657_04600 [Geodermatophilus amargosae]
MGALVGEVLLPYREAPADRPRELAAFLTTTVGWERGQAAEVPPRVVRRAPVPTRVVRRSAGVPEVPDLAALAWLLDVDQGELAWFADVRGLERTAPDEALRHYRWRVLERPDGVRLVAVLSMDLESFFASVPASRVSGVLQGVAGLTEPVAHGGHRPGDDGGPRRRVAPRAGPRRP